jgi:hypothetical protein
VVEDMLNQPPNRAIYCPIMAFSGVKRATQDSKWQERKGITFLDKSGTLLTGAIRGKGSSLRLTLSKSEKGRRGRS